MAAKPTKRTAISAGLLISSLLNGSTKVTSSVNRIFPNIAEEKATPPYICYKRESLNKTSVKNLPGANTTSYVVEVFAKDYPEGVDIAENVAEALDGIQAVYTDDDGTELIARSITLIDGAEGYADGAYFQQLYFEVKVN